VLIFRWPVLSLHILVIALVMIGTADLFRGSPQSLLWPFLTALCGYFWFLAYAVRDQGSKDRWPVLAQLGTFYPFWGSRPIPYGKGAAYLRKFEATNAEELAVTQIKGAKLLVWAYLLKAVHMAFTSVIHDTLQIPRFDDAFEKHALGTSYSLYASWGAVISNYFETLLTLAYTGHIIIAIARFAGFRLLRNTYRPLTSRTLAEFWNRYYFYFKELLVEFYYYPTFFQCFKKRKNLRLLFATFMAAGVGNAFYHFVRDIHYVQSMGLLNALIGYQTYIFYCLILSLSIGVSQLRPRRDLSKMSPFRRLVLAPVGVASFFCILLIFSYAGRQYSLAQHFLFLFHLFGG
jgi:D-alanyl-lipoteichoic acid acyltransferase DltB (MBOAT superfamily)